MAEFSKEQGAFLQYQMRLKLKTQLMNLATLTGRQIASLLFELRQVSSNSEYTRLVRQYLPIIMEQSGENGALLTAKYYQEARDVNLLTVGAVVVAGSTFLVRPDSYKKKSDLNTEILDRKMNMVSYNFNKLWSPELVYDLEPVKSISMMDDDSLENIITTTKIKSSTMNQERKNKILHTLPKEVEIETIDTFPTYSEEKIATTNKIMNSNISLKKKEQLLESITPDGKIDGFITGTREVTSRIQLEKPIIEIVERAPIDYSYIENEALMEEDPNAGESAKRTTTAGSCVFCKHMATFVGSEGWAKDKFHNGCKCTPGASFAYEANYQPKWSGDYEEEYYRVQDELIEEARHFEKRKIPTTRYSESQGKEVKSMKTVWIDTRTGKEGIPPKTGSRAVVAKITANARK